jgi:hypothetical protein
MQTPTLLNGGWAIGPHIIMLESKKGQAYLRQADPALIFDEPRAAVRFSLSNLDCLFLNFNDAAQILCALELAGFEAKITDMNALDPPTVAATPQE